MADFPARWASFTAEEQAWLESGGERREKSLSKRIPLRSSSVNHTLIKGISHQINEEE